MTDYLVKNARLVNEGAVTEGDLLLRRGRIERIGGEIGIPPGVEVVDAGGLALLPGMIDDQVHFREGAFFALKGNKTLELRRYRYPDPLQLGDGTKAGTAGPVRALDFDIRPNPTNSGRALVSLVGSTKARLEVAVYDVRGCRVAASESAGETDQMLVDLSRLSAGVYLCRVKAGGWTGTRKLIIER